MRNNTCGGCNLALPSGQLADMRHVDADLVLCCNCSIYLLPALPVEADPDAVVAKPAAKKVAVKKPRKPKVAKAIAADEAAAAAEEEELETEVESEADAPEESEAAAEDPATTPAEIAADLALPAEAQVEEEAETEAEIALPA
jgi:hypothetical protein